MILRFIGSLISGIIEKYRDRFFSVFFSYLWKEYFHRFNVTICFGDDRGYLVWERIQCSKNIELSSSCIGTYLFCSFFSFLLPSIVILIIIDLMHRIQEEYNRIIFLGLFDIWENLCYCFSLNFLSLMLSGDKFGFFVRKIEFFLQYR